MVWPKHEETTKTSCFYQITRHIRAIKSLPLQNLQPPENISRLGKSKEHKQSVYPGVDPCDFIEEICGVVKNSILRKICPPNEFKDWMYTRYMTKQRDSAEWLQHVAAMPCSAVQEVPALVYSPLAGVLHCEFLLRGDFVSISQRRSSWNLFPIAKCLQLRWVYGHVSGRWNTVVVSIFWCPSHMSRKVVRLYGRARLSHRGITTTYMWTCWKGVSPWVWCRLASVCRI